MATVTRADRHSYFLLLAIFLLLLLMLGALLPGWISGPVCAVVGWYCGNVMGRKWR